MKEERKEEEGGRRKGGRNKKEEGGRRMEEEGVAREWSGVCEGVPSSRTDHSIGYLCFVNCRTQTLLTGFAFVSTSVVSLP